MALLFQLLLLELRHLSDNLFHICCGIVGQTIASEGFLYLTLADFAEGLIGVTHVGVVDNCVVVVLVEKVIATVQPWRLVGLRQVGRIAVVELGGFGKDAFVVALLLQTVEELRVVGALKVGDGGVEGRLFLHGC